MWIVVKSPLHRINRYALIACLAACAAFMTSPAQALNEIRVDVPVRPAGQLQLSEVEMTLTLDNANPIALRITGPRGTRETRAMVLTDASTDCFVDSSVPGGLACFAEMPTPGAPVNDNVLIIKPLHGSSTSPPTETNKLRVLLQFPRVDRAQCIGGISSQERWTINVVGGAERIVSVSVLSFDRRTQSPPACSTGRRVVPASEGAIASVLRVPTAPINVVIN